MTERSRDELSHEPSDRTGPVHDQISAFLDDELSEEETAFLVRRFERDPEAREQLRRYTTIGCALRGELLKPDPNVLRRRIASVWGGAAPIQVARVVRGRDWRAAALRPVLGVGIAAAVAVAAVVTLRSANEARFELEGAASPAPLQTRQWTEPPSYVVPQDVAETRAVAPPIRLTNYLVHHGEYASHLSRTSVHSNVVGAQVLPAAADPEPIVQPAALE